MDQPRVNHTQNMKILFAVDQFLMAAVAEDSPWCLEFESLLSGSGAQYYWILGKESFFLHYTFLFNYTRFTPNLPNTDITDIMQWQFISIGEL